MATDPVRRIRSTEGESALSTPLGPMLDALAVMPPSTATPYLTVSVDWRSDSGRAGRNPAPQPLRSELGRVDETGTPNRAGRIETHQALTILLKGLTSRSAAAESVGADLERIMQYLDHELPAQASGAIIVANHGQGVFATVPLDVNPDTSLVTGPVPSARALLHAIDDFPAYAVLVADANDATLYRFERETWEHAIQVEANEYPRFQSTGGLAQQRLKNRAEVRLDAFAKAVADQMYHAFLDWNQAVKYLIIAAIEPMNSALKQELHRTVSERIIGEVNLPVTSSELEIVAAARPLVAAAERRAEQAAVEAVKAGAYSGRNGAIGADDTLAAIQTGSVGTLVINDDYALTGWADYTLPLFGVGEVPATHPAGGDVANIVPVQLCDELVVLALQMGAAIEQVQTSPDPATDGDTGTSDRSAAAVALDTLGGVGAILRYNPTERDA